MNLIQAAITLKVKPMNDQSFYILMMLLSLAISFGVAWIVMVTLKKAGYKKVSEIEAERKKKINAMHGITEKY